tara:strand:+ start:16721 stop:17518 length:798 start_codon:yes stop_codon:yes gene_type:complete
MYIGISAATKRDPRKYRWLEYGGRKATLHLTGSDKEEYEVEFLKGEKFGIKSHRGHVYVLHEDERSVQFKLKPADAKRIIENSKGYEGKIGRYKVLPYDGGKDKKEMRARRRDSKGRKHLITDSSMFSELYHDSKENKLYVKFRNGALWEYDEVTLKEARALERAASQGRWFNRRIKGVKPETRLSRLPKGFESLSGSTVGEHEGEGVRLNRPFRLRDSDKEYGVYVTNPNGKTVLVKFDNRDKSSGGEEPDKTDPGYWARQLDS